MFGSNRIRKNGEWFYPSKELIEHVNKISNYFIELNYINNELNIYSKMKN